MAVRVTRARVNAWRLVKHHLVERASKGKIANVVSDVCGVHAQLMSAAELSLWARVSDVTPNDVQEALWKQRTLVKTWCMRGTLHLLASSELPSYVAALKTRTGYRNKSWLKFYRLSLSEIEHIITQVRVALDGRQLTRQQLASEATKGMSSRIRKEMSSGWGSLLKPAAYQGNLCFGPSQGQNATFVRPDQWIGEWKEPDTQEALKERFRRYLAAYGPATRTDFARWWGMLPGRSGAVARSVSNELQEVVVDGQGSWILGKDVEDLKKAEPSESVRLLPNFDCYLLGCYPRESLVEPRFQSRVYRPQAWVSPVVLMDGAVAGIWKHHRKRDRVEVAIEPFVKLNQKRKDEIEREVAGIGRFYGVSSFSTFTKSA